MGAERIALYGNIPSELKAEKAWVNVWDRSKVPMQTRIGKAASSSKPETWGTFDEAVANVEDGTLDGIGYVFHNTGVVGIDIDTGFDEDCFLSETASDIISKCESYTEKSRSGRGFHVLLRGSLPFDGKNNRAGVEIYRSRRFFIMTGKTMFFHEIVENQEAVDYVVSKYFPEVQKESTDSPAPRIYSPIFKKPGGGKIYISPTYPPIRQGGRNLSLTSLAGQMHSQGWPKKAMFRELLTANAQACKPPLPRAEIEAIINSVTKYKR